mgnify:FL=1
MKCKIGDLVMLSAAGNKNHHNHHLVGGWGIIKKLKRPRLRRDHFPIEAEWYDGVGFGKEFTRGGVHFKPYELKKFKK